METIFGEKVKSKKENKKLETLALRLSVATQTGSTLPDPPQQGSLLYLAVAGEEE